jgi:NTE family protein
MCRLATRATKLRIFGTIARDREAEMEGRRALVLSGGSIRGAYQAAAIKRRFEQGFLPDLIAGASVGALNGAFLASHVEANPGEKPTQDHWVAAADALVQFWRREITGPHAIIEERNRLWLTVRVLFRDFDGLLSTAPLRRLLQATIEADRLKRSPVPFWAGVVNLTTGAKDFIPHDATDAVTAVLASTAIPIAMPTVDLREARYCDGGLRDVAPTGHAISKGATDVDCIACYSRAFTSATFTSKDLFATVNRIADILIDELLKNDIATTLRCNQLAVNGVTRYRRVTLTEIRPAAELAPSIKQDLRDFSRDTIEAYLTLADDVVVHP